MTDETYMVGLCRLGNNIKRHRLIDFSNKDEITIGRSPDVTVCLPSTLISRCHAVFKKEGQNWTVTDNKSLNGISVNGKRLEKQIPRQLEEGDVIQLGIPENSSENSEFVFKFHTKIKKKRARPKSLDEPDCANTSVPPSRFPMKRLKVDNERPSCSKENINKNYLPYEEYKEKVSNQEQEASRKLKEFEEKLAEMQKMLKEKEDAQEDMKKKLEEEKLKRENQTLQMTEKLKEKEIQLEHQTIEMREKLKEKEKELEEEMKKKEEYELKMKEELENQLLSREAQLMEQLQNQKETLISEKQKVEESLQQAMAKALEEKDRELEQELRKEKERLDNVITQKETEQKMLEAQLLETKQEKDQQSEAILSARQDILSNFADLMETELQCSICNELYVQATSLSCSHSFCSFCIAEWMKVKKECPVCRAPVTSQMRSIALDNYIDTMVQHLSDELKTRRKELVANRKEEQQKREEAARVEAQNATNRNNARGRGRGRARGRGGRRRQANNAPNPVTVNRQGHRPIIIEDDDDDNVEIGVVEMEVDGSNESSSSDSSTHFFSDANSSEDEDRGDPDAYFGGYGACFVCGSRGHWANGCPYR